jgi:hypothetical protein
MRPPAEINYFAVSKGIMVNPNPIWLTFRRGFELDSRRYGIER